MLFVSGFALVCLVVWFWVFLVLCWFVLWFRFLLVCFDLAGLDVCGTCTVGGTLLFSVCCSVWFSLLRIGFGLYLVFVIWFTWVW